MGTQCNIEINNVTYYKHYDGYSGGITLVLLDSVINNKICLQTFIKKGNLEKVNIKTNRFFNVSETEINGVNIFDFMVEGLNEIVRSQQGLYQSIKEEDARTRYFDSLRGESLNKTEEKMRLHKIFKNGYPTEAFLKDKFDLIESLRQN
jgi:hypothetical protein